MLFFVAPALLALVPPALAGGEPPVAEAGLGLIAYVDDTVILDGSGSSDPEGDPLTWAWTQVGGPPVTLEDADTAQPRFQVVEAGTLRFELVVSDDVSASAADTVEVVVPHEDIDGVRTACAHGGGAQAGAPLAAVALLAALRSRRPRRG